MRHLQVLATHEHDVTDVEKVDPAQGPLIQASRLSAIKAARSSDAKLVSLRLSVDIEVTLCAFNVFQRLEVQLKSLNGLRRHCILIRRYLVATAHAFDFISYA